MPAIEPQDYKNLQTGLVCEGAVSEHRSSLDSVTESLNFHFDKIGSATQRKGTTLLGNQISASSNILGLYEFRDSGSGTNNQIIAVNGTVAYYLSGSTWTSKRTSLTSGSKARFTTFLDFVWMVNGTEATAIWSGSVGDNFVTTGNAASAPTGKFISVFKARVWIAGNSTYPDRLYFSSLPSAVTTPVVTWDTDVSTGNWIDISPSDGENITALIRDNVALLVFKNNHLYRVFSTTQVDADPKFSIGTYSQESVVGAKDGVYFHHPSGFYRYYNGDIQEISRPVNDFVKNITVANYSKVCAKYDGEHIEWAVGNVTVNGITYSNLSLRYTISTKTWTHYTHPSQHLVFSNYNDGTTLFYIVGDDNGNILKLDTGNDDNSTPISLSLVHRWYTGDGFWATRKTPTSLLFANKGGRGLNVNYQEDNDLVNDWSKKVGQLSNFATIFPSVPIKARRCRFRLSGQASGEPVSYDGFEVIKGNVDINLF